MATRHNLCQNPACSVSIAGWGGASTPAQTPVTGFGRTTAARYTAGTFMSTAATSSGAVTAGLDYTLSIYVRVATFAVPSGVIYVEWINAGGSGFGYPSASFTASIGAVTRVSITATAPANAVAARVVVDGINYNINTADFTALLIEQAGTLGTYFDGDSPSASWDGTAGLSSSTLTDTQISAVTARSTLALSGAASARKLAPATGQAAAGLAGTIAARKISPIAAANLIALAASGAGRKISPVISTAAAALTGSSTARKNTPAEGRAAAALTGIAAARKTTPAVAASYALLGGYHSQVTSRAVTGISSLALTSRAATAKVARTSSSTTIALTGIAAARHVAAASGTSSILLAGNAAGAHLATATGSASLLLTGATAPRRITTVTGRGVLLLTTRMANVGDPGLPVFAVGPPQLRWHAGPPRIGRP